MRIQSSAFSFLPRRKYLLFLVVFACFFYCLSCNRETYVDEHPDFVDAVYKRMDTASDKDLDRAFIFIDSAFNRLTNPGTGDIFIRDSTKAIRYSIAKNDHTKAISLLNNLLTLIKEKTREEKYAERYASLLYQKGALFLNVKRYNESLYYITQGEQAVLTLVKNKCSMAFFTTVKAFLLFQQEKYLESAACFQKQYNEFLASCDPVLYKRSLHAEGYLSNIALCYLRAGVLDSAAWYQEAALDMLKANESMYVSKIEFKYAGGIIYADKAELLALKGNLSAAEALYKKSIGCTNVIDVQYTQASLARLADAYLKDSKPDSAQLVLDQLKRSLDTMYYEKQMIGWYKLSVKYYEQKKQLNTAFKYQQQYQAIRDSIEARDKKFISVDIAKEFENLELKYSNDVLQKDGKLKTIYLGFAIAIFVTITAIAIFTWLNLKHTRKLHQQMKQKNDAMQKTLTSLEQSHQENNRIVRIIAHDLKSPVSTINNLAFSLLRKDLPGDLKEILELIKRACSNSMVLINDALLQKKKTAVIRKELVDMKKLLEYCVGLLQTKAAEKNQHLTLHAEDISIMLNRQKMWRVVSNIVNNAIKFSPEHTAIAIKLQRTENTILLSVQDQGIGIPENLKDKIFTISPEASRQGTFGEESYGLGLSISQKIIEEHQGKIWFDSNTDSGSVFYVELPWLN